MGTSTGGARRSAVRPRFLITGVAVFVGVVAGVIALGWIFLELTVPEPDLGGLLEEQIWSEIPLGGTVVFTAQAPTVCDSGGSAIAFMRVDVDSGGDEAVAFYEDVATRTGWTLTDDHPYRGARKFADGREYYVSFNGWDTEGGGGTVEIRGYSQPNGC